MRRCSRIRGAIGAAALAILTAAGCAARRPVPTTPAPPVASPSPAAPAMPSPAPSPAIVGDAHRQRIVVLVGDSTTFGTPEPHDGAHRTIQSPYNPGATLAALLAHVEPSAADGGTPWRDARVYNLGVGASTTALWLADPPQGCGSALELFPVIKAACAAKVSWIAASPSAVDGGHVDAVIVDLGLNDLLITNDPAETVARLKKIRKMLAPTPVLFFPPIAPPSGPRGDWPRRVRDEMVRRGLFSEQQYPAYLPTFDDLHPTDGGYAAKAGLWLDALRKLP